MMYGTVRGLKAPHVDAVETKQRQGGRKTARWPVVVSGKDFGHAQANGQQVMGAIAPVVEITGNQQWRICRNGGFNMSGQCIVLVAPRASEQREMHANAMQRQGQMWHSNTAMKQSAFFEAQARDILIVGVNYRVAGEDGIAMMAVVINHVAAIGMAGPDTFGKELVLRLVRPVVMVLRVKFVLSLYLLQKDDIRVERSQSLPQFMYHHAAVELRKALVDVPGGDG